MSSRDGRSIQHYTADDFKHLKAAGQLAAATLDMITEHVRPGITTGELDRIVHEYTLEHGATPAPLNYHGFPKSCCISLNHVVCHGIPGDRRLQEGDILNIDVTSILNGWYGDTSRFAEKNRLGVVRDFCGHGIGRNFHEAPSVLHYGRPGQGTVLKAGMVFTIEPMLNLGRPDVKVLADDWTAVTRDRSLSAQFEHQLGVTEDGYEIFTLSPRGYTKPPYSL